LCSQPRHDAAAIALLAKMADKKVRKSGITVPIENYEFNINFVISEYKSMTTLKSCIFLRSLIKIHIVMHVFGCSFAPSYASIFILFLPFYVQARILLKRPIEYFI
jgi:hypothetical protein